LSRFRIIVFEPNHPLVDTAPELIPSNPKLFALIEPDDDASLLQRMACREREKGIADAAWEVFYTRHREWLWRKCYCAAEPLGGITWVREIFQDTLVAVLSGAGKFRLPDGVPPEAITPHVKAWMGTILKNNLCLRLRDRRKQSDLAEALTAQASSKPAEWLEFTDRPVQPLPYQRAFDEAFAALTEREQTVLRVTYQFHHFGDKSQRLPSSQLAELAEQLSVTPENLRAIRMRAMRKLRAQLEPHLTDNQPEPSYSHD
jgi:RNA polymerase sigma factor (sigma-70 family)